ncbi:hypothetical protein [Streptomyces griseofuscus]|uniref:hypothetical protein n=1 Tax=Streptomyces griseofuscus TaxID=146922 RepID=UPI0038030B81
MDRLPEQPGIGDPPVPKAYGEPRRRADARAATTDEGPKTSSDAAAGRPRERRVLLPGATPPARPMAPVREAANQRLRDTPHGTPHTGHRAAPDSPPAVPPGEPVPDPDRLRRGPGTDLGPAAEAAPARAEATAALGTGTSNAPNTAAAAGGAAAVRVGQVERRISPASPRPPARRTTP